MVAGKNTTNQLARAAAAPKLPPLPKLRVRKPDQTNANPCLGVMTTMLGMRASFVADRVSCCNCAMVLKQGTMLTLDKTGCWASSGHTAQGCAALEQSLRDCMAVNVRENCFHLSPRWRVITAGNKLTITLTETQGQQQEQDQPDPFPPVSPDQAPAQEELDATVYTAAGRWGLLKLFGITHSDIGTAFFIRGCTK